MNHLSNIYGQLCQWAQAFRADTSGGLSVEYMLWVPFMASGMVLTTDITILMREQSQLFIAARDTSRMVAIGQYDTTRAVQVMEDRLGTDKAYAVKAEADGLFVNAGVSVPFKDVLVFGSMFTGDGTLTGYATMLIEGGNSAQ